MPGPDGTGGLLTGCTVGLQTRRVSLLNARLVAQALGITFQP